MGKFRSTQKFEESGKFKVSENEVRNEKSAKVLFLMFKINKFSLSATQINGIGIPDKQQDGLSVNIPTLNFTKFLIYFTY